MFKDVKQNWKKVLINVNTTVMAAIKQLDQEALRILLVVDENQRLLGVITDGDIRRFLLKQASLEATVLEVMNPNPVTASVNESQDHLLMKIHTLGILHLPIVDEAHCVVGLETFDTLFAKTTYDNWVVFMAGGMGKRLYPLTQECPKPLLKVGAKPISEILLEHFIKCGFKHFFFSVNYKSAMIRDYYGDGSRFGVQIEYIEENDALGTAGSLSLLPSPPDLPFFVVNADILTNINFAHVLEFHREHRQKIHATLCMRQYHNTIPYGLVHIDQTTQQLLHIEEKPTHTCFVSAGIYILEPQVLSLLPFNAYCDMPELLSKLVQRNMRVLTFPIREYWLDIGHHDDLARASTDYQAMFS